MLGEFLVNFLLTKFLPKEHYTLIKNVTLPTDDGTTQIDHIVVSEFGLFVIETKNMKGWIFGSANKLNEPNTLLYALGMRYLSFMDTFLYYERT